MTNGDLSPEPSFFTLGEDCALTAILREKYAFYLESAAADILERQLSRMRADQPDFALSISTASTYRCNIAEPVAASLVHRFKTGKDLIMPIDTCLQEALSNAVLHGNLAIVLRPETPEEFEAYYREIESRLASEPCASRRVLISAWDDATSLRLAVTDEGKGLSTLNIPLVSKTQKTGRGLLLIRSLADQVWIGEDRRTLYMAFNVRR